MHPYIALRVDGQQSTKGIETNGNLRLIRDYNYTYHLKGIQQ